MNDSSFEFERELTVEEQRGKELLRYFNRTLILFYIAFFVLLSIPKGFPGLLQPLLRETLSILLLWWVYRGIKPAKWIAIVLYTAAGVFGTYQSLQLEFSGVVFALMSFSATCLAYSSVLLFSQTANAFLEYQREGRSK